MKALMASKKTRRIVGPLVVFFFFFIIFKLTSGGDTPYNYFVRLADAFAHGRLYLKNSEPWLSELIPTDSGYFVPYSPFPAIIALPFVFLFGDFSQTTITNLVGATIPLSMYLLGRRKGMPASSLVFLTLLTGIGTILWFESAVGSTWYFGQVTAAACLMWAIYAATTQKYPLLVGALVGAAYMSRVHTIFSLPFFLYLLKDVFYKENKIQWKPVFLFATGLSLFLVTNAWYNFARFGVIWDRGYLLIPGVLEEPWFSKGIIHYSYIPKNLHTLFLSMPVIIQTPPYIQPSWFGLSILITTPVFLFAMKARAKRWDIRLSLLSVLCIGTFVLMHGNNGGTQFGVRYAIDFYPFLFFILMDLFHTKKPSTTAWVLLVIGILVNTWGVLWINFFHWVSF
jgi:hypothetical protein